MPRDALFCAIITVKDQKVDAELLNRLKRAEAQLRGVQCMIDEGAFLSRASGVLIVGLAHNACLIQEVCMSILHPSSRYLVSPPMLRAA
jgi:hypothetical protein